MLARFKRGRIVHAVARHRHDLIARLERFHDAHLVLRADARKDISVLDGLDQRRIVHSIEFRAGVHLPVRLHDADLGGNSTRGVGIIAGDHDGADARVPRLLHRRFHFGPRRIDHADQPDKDQIFFDVIGGDVLGARQLIEFRDRPRPARAAPDSPWHDWRR